MIIVSNYEQLLLSLMAYVIEKKTICYYSLND